MTRWLVLIAICALASPVSGATYYVATTGNNSNDGSAESPWRYPQKCAGAPVAAGDTCIVRSGTYSLTGSGNTSTVIRISSSAGSAAGTSAAPITIKSEVPYGAVIQVPSVAGSQSTAISVSRAYYIIEGFEIDGSATTYQTSSTHFGHAGIAVYSPNVVVRRNKIHHIARTQCSNSPYGNAATYTAQGFSNVTFEYNLIYSIGRLRNGESGCSTDKFQHDHGFYGNWGSGLIFRYNVIYDTNRGYPMNIHTADGVEHTHSGYKIHNNTFGGEAPQTSSPHGQIVMGGKWVNAEIKNNVFLDTSPAGVIQSALFLSTAAHSGNVVSYNRTNVNTTGSDPIFVNAVPTGFTSSNNSRNATLGLTNASCTGTGGSCTATDFSLASGSALINAGTVISGAAYNGAAPDIGAFESIPAPTSASATSVYIDVTLPMSVNTPARALATTGWSMTCSPSCGPLSIASVALLSGASGAVRVQVSGWTAGACQNTYTLTISYSTGSGSLTDSADIGGLFQPLHTFGPLSVTNNCSGSGPPAPPGTPYLIYEFDGNANDSSGNGRHGVPIGATYTTGQTGQALQGAENTAVSVTALFGTGANPTQDSFTVAFWYEVPLGSEGLLRTLAGTTSGTNQRLYIATRNGTFQVGAQNQSIGASDTSNLSSSAGWHRLCLRVDASTDTITLYKDGVAGTGGATKTVTSYTLPSDFNFGLPTGFNPVANAGAGKWDRGILWNSLVSCVDDWDAVKPTTPPTAGSLAQVAYKLQFTHLDPSDAVTDYRGVDTPGDVVSPGAVAIVFQINCTGGDCGQTAMQLWYSTDCVNFLQAVPNIPSSHGVSFWGASTDAHLNRFSAGAALSGALTHTAGPTQLTADAIPNTTFTSGTSMTLRYIPRFADGLAGQSRCFKLYRQDGTALSSYAPSEGARVNLVNPRASAGF